MKKYFKIALVLTLMVAVSMAPTLSGAVSLEYPYVYKSPRSLGMGGAGVAIGGRFDTVFANPAGLSTMEDDDWEVNLLNLSVSYGQNVQDFMDDIDKAFDAGDANGDGDTSDDELMAINDVLTKYRGKNLHLNAANLTSLGRGGDAMSWGAGVFGNFRMDAIPHQGFGSDGLLEMHTRVDYGAVIGVGFNGSRSFKPGASMKFVNREAMDHVFSARQIVENQDRLEDYITDDLLTEGSALGLDVGMIYEFRDAWLTPAIGVSALNIGGMDFGDAGEVPMSLNVGLSARTSIPLLGDVTMGADLVDATGEMEEDDDIAKRLRIGAEALFIDNMLTTVALRLGAYQGYGTFGVDARFSVVTVSYNTYAEELGAYAGQEADRRHILSLGIGW